MTAGLLPAMSHFSPSRLFFSGVSRWTPPLLDPLFPITLRHDVLSIHEHSPSGHRHESDTQSVLTSFEYSQVISEYNTILSYYDKKQAKRFHWQEAFASSEYRSSFFNTECERTNLPHPAWLMALAGCGWGKNFHSNNKQYPKWRTCL